jgi:hypothetical protein
MILGASGINGPRGEEELEMFGQHAPRIRRVRFTRSMVLLVVLIMTMSAEAEVAEIGPQGPSIARDARRAVWTHLAAFDRSERENAVLDVELGAGAAAPDKAAAAGIAGLWDSGSYDDAISILRALEAGGLPVAVGVSWKEPVPLGAGGRGMDVRVGAPHFWAKQTSLEGEHLLYAAVVWDHTDEWGWSMNRSEDYGASWVETYHKYTTDAVLDLDTGGGVVWFVFVAYVWAGDPAVPKMSRFWVSDGTIDTGYGDGGVKEVYDATPAMVEEIGVDMTEGIFEWITVVFALQSDGQLRCFRAIGEEPTGVTNASGGLDTASGGNLWLSGYVASYIGTDGGVYVLRMPGNPVYLEQFSGAHEHTSVAAYLGGETRYYICAVEHEYPNGQGIKHWLSVDDGASWSPSFLVYPRPGEGEYMMPAVAASLEGYAAVYQQETGAFDQVFFMNKPGLELGEWWQDPVPINDFTVDIGSPLEIRDIGPIIGEESYAYGILYITQHPQYWLTWPLFDRSPGPGGYCHAWGDPYDGLYISNVSVGSIDHWSDTSYGGYGEHTDHSTDMEIGAEYELTVTAEGSIAADECGAWIDWNQDLDFDDSYETISVSGSPGEGPYTATIVPPGGAAFGETRMRIRVVREVTPLPCGGDGGGEVEDYTIVVTAGYCAASGGCGQYISRVELAGMDNESECDEYINYGAIVGDLLIGAEYPMTITIANGYDGNLGGLWIDWNQDCDFDDAEEEIALSPDWGPGPYHATVIPPPEAVLGETRMRVRLHREVDWPDPCGDEPYGEVEDYVVNVAADYCAASATCDAYIERVQLGDLDNASECDTGYSNYTDLSAAITLGTARQITITIGNAAGYEYGAVFIDWNQDLVFGYPSEEVPLTGSPGPGPYTGAVIPPADAVPGETRMRVRVSGEEDPPGPCGPTETGEVEDYTINIVESPYCTAFSECDEYISRVEFGDIDNMSECAFGWFGYWDFTNLSTDLTIGMDTPITITIEYGEEGDQGGLWIDWNQDEDFEDAEETIALDGSPGAGPYSASVNPPPDASLGETRMRVRVVRDHEPEPCGEQDAGEVEDYTVVVVEGQECPADFDGDGDVDTADLLHLLGCWGTDCGDVDGDGDTDTADLLALLAAWGECP